MPHVKLTRAAEALRLAAVSLEESAGVGNVTGMRRRYRVVAQAPRTGKETNWQLRIYPPHGEGKPHQRSAKTRDEVEARAIAAREQARLNAGNDPDAGQTLPAVAAPFLAHLERVGEHSENTLRNYRDSLARMTRLVGKPSRAALHAARDVMLEDGLAARTVQSHEKAARVAWEWALDREIVTLPWPKLKPLHVRDTELRPPTGEELAAIFASARTYQGGRYWPLVALVAETGCRASEACSLRGADVDRERRVVHFVRRWKARASRRSVPISAHLVELLPEVADDAPLFVGARSGKQLSGASLSNLFRRILRDAGLQDRDLGSIHCLRRAFVTAAQSAEVRLEVSMSLSGHSDVRTHAGYARRAVSAAKREAARQVREVLALPYGPGNPLHVDASDSTPEPTPEPTSAPHRSGGKPTQARGNEPSAPPEAPRNRRRALNLKHLKRIPATGSATLTISQELSRAVNPLPGSKLRAVTAPRITSNPKVPHSRKPA
jgi:integrase